MEGWRVALRPHRGSGCWVPPFGPPVLHGGHSHRVFVHPEVSGAELPLDFLPHLARVRGLQRAGVAGVSCPSWLQAALGIPVLWHATGPIPYGFAICILPTSILGAGARIYFRIRNGSRKEQKECVGSRALPAGVHPGRGCSGSSSGAQLSFPAGIFPLWEYLGVPSQPHRLRTPCARAPQGRDIALALQI